MIEDGKLYTVQGSEDNRGEVESGYFTSYQLQNIPPGVLVNRVRLYIEHHEEEDISANPLTWQAGVGPLANPIPLARVAPAVVPGEANEATVAWDVSPWFIDATGLNNLKLSVINRDANGKKTKNDRIYAVVEYRLP